MLLGYTHTKKYPPGKQKFDDLCPITQEDKGRALQIGLSSPLE